MGATAFFSGCAHPISVSPDVSKIENTGGHKRIEKNVGYYISQEKKDLEVTTPGGGGDKIKYKPYGDIEIALYKMLGNVFSDVTALKTPTDAESIKQHKIVFVFTPAIATNSSSPSLLTWPPTQFTVNLTCNIMDSSGKVVATKSVTGEGKAEWDEFKHDFSLSARRATQDALLKMQEALLTSPDLRN